MIDPAAASDQPVGSYAKGCAVPQLAHWPWAGVFCARQAVLQYSLIKPWTTWARLMRASHRPAGRVGAPRSLGPATGAAGAGAGEHLAGRRRDPAVAIADQEPEPGGAFAEVDEQVTGPAERSTHPWGVR